MTEAFIYQDLVENSDDINAGEVFFELANEKLVGYRTKSGHLVEVAQTPNIKDSTGGIVWETSFFLSTFIEESALASLPGKSVLEVGAGCGLLGLVLAYNGCDVVCTEATETLSVLQGNFTDGVTSSVKKAGGSIRAQLLRWEEPSDRVALSTDPDTPIDFDVILGTDVFFDKALVAPLLETMVSLAHRDTVVWLCFQERCAAAHDELLKLAPSYFNAVENASERLAATPGCAAAATLDCWLLRLSEPVLREEPQRGSKCVHRSVVAAAELFVASSSPFPEKQLAPSVCSSSSSSSSSQKSPSPLLPSWMAAAFSRSSSRAEPDVEVRPFEGTDENDFDGGRVSDLALSWQQQLDQETLALKSSEKHRHNERKRALSKGNRYHPGGGDSSSSRSPKKKKFL